MFYIGCVYIAGKHEERVKKKKHQRNHQERLPHITHSRIKVVIASIMYSYILLPFFSYSLKWTNSITWPKLYSRQAAKFLLRQGCRSSIQCQKCVSSPCHKVCIMVQSASQHVKVLKNRGIWTLAKISTL